MGYLKYQHMQLAKQIGTLNRAYVSKLQVAIIGCDNFNLHRKLLSSYACISHLQWSGLSLDLCYSCAVRGSCDERTALKWHIQALHGQARM